MSRKSFSTKERTRLFALYEAKTIPEPNSGCLIWLGSTKGIGYGNLYFAGRYHGAHRLSYEIFVGRIPAGNVVRHNCDNPFCVNPNHLSVGTPKENVHDCIARGRDRRGKTGARKLTLDQVAEIRSRRRYYGYRRDWAAEFCVSESAIGKISYGKTWGNHG